MIRDRRWRGRCRRLAGWLDRRPARGVRSCSTWPRDWVSLPQAPSSVRLSASSLSHLASRERLPRPSRDYMLRHLPRSSPADLSRAAVLPTVIFSLLLSIYLFRSSPNFSFSLSIRFATASVSAPRRAAPRWRQHGPAASLSLIRALVPLRHSSCSFRTLSLAVYPPCIRLSSPPSSYNLLLSRGATILPRPKRRHTYASSFSPGLIQQPSFSSSGILCRFRNSVPLYNGCDSLEKSRHYP